MENDRCYFWAASTPYYMYGEEHGVDDSVFNIVTLKSESELPGLLPAYELDEEEVGRYIINGSGVDIADCALDGDCWNWDVMLADGYCGFYWEDDMFGCTCYCLDRSVIESVSVCSREDAIRNYKSLRESIGVRKRLLESVSSVCYHYTSMYSLCGIIGDDMFNLDTNDTNPVMGDNKEWYSISVTRSRNDNSGYASAYRTDEYNGAYVRLTLNGDKFNERYKGIHVDEFSDYDFEDEVTVDDFETSRTRPELASRRLFMMQGEDRVLSSKNVIYNAHEYITRIDVVILDQSTYGEVDDNDSLFGDIEYVAKRCINDWRYRGKLFIYLDRDEFNKQSNKCYTPEEFLRQLSMNEMIDRTVCTTIGEAL